MLGYYLKQQLANKRLNNFPPKIITHSYCQSWLQGSRQTAPLLAFPQQLCSHKAHISEDRELGTIHSAVKQWSPSRAEQNSNTHSKACTRRKWWGTVWKTTMDYKHLCKFCHTKCDSFTWIKRKLLSVKALFGMLALKKLRQKESKVQGQPGLDIKIWFKMQWKFCKYFYLITRHNKVHFFSVISIILMLFKKKKRCVALGVGGACL